MVGDLGEDVIYTEYRDLWAGGSTPPNLDAATLPEKEEWAALHQPLCNGTLAGCTGSVCCQVQLWHSLTTKT
eukprot:COSAG01_NODE_7594_length_3134_cov_5.924547_3_plen_72_part_00